jgi:hypothetical protein
VRSKTTILANRKDASVTTATLTNQHRIKLPRPVLEALGAQANALVAHCAAAAAGRRRTVTLGNAAAKAGMPAFR